MLLSSGRSAPGSAPHGVQRGREFESRRPDHAETDVVGSFSK